LLTDVTASWGIFSRRLAGKTPLITKRTYPVAIPIIQ